MRAVDAIMECLKAEGVELVFGIPGGANLPTYDALYDAGIRHVHVPPRAGRGTRGRGLREGRRAASASRFATSGPGATNLVTAIADAQMDRVPTVFITGQVRTELIGTDGFQEADISGITMPIVKHSVMIQDPREIPRAMHEAFHIARTGRPGPVLVDVPQDLSRADITYEPVDGPQPARLPADHGGQREADPPGGEGAGQLRRRPVIYGGGGIVNADASRRVHRARACRTASRSRCTADGPGRVPGRRTSSGSGCSACTAPAPPTTRWTRPT